MVQLRVDRLRFKTEVDKRCQSEFISGVAENLKPQCQICGQSMPSSAGPIGDLIRPSLLEFLSCLAALQAPVIMMSQNRTKARDRARAENDYKVNLKAELEIRHLREKIDHLLRKQYNRLFKIQQVQIELLEEIGQKRRGSGARPTPIA